jgi:hypothetical protein
MERYILYCKLCGSPVSMNVGIEKNQENPPVVVLELICICKKPKNKVKYYLHDKSRHMEHDYEFKVRS